MFDLTLTYKTGLYGSQVIKYFVLTFVNKKQIIHVANKDISPYSYSMNHLMSSSGHYYIIYHKILLCHSLL